MIHLSSYVQSSFQSRLFTVSNFWPLLLRWSCSGAYIEPLEVSILYPLLTSYFCPYALNCTVGKVVDLMIEIERAVGVPLDRQNLYATGNFLKPKKALAKCGAFVNSFIVLRVNDPITGVLEYGTVKSSGTCRRSNLSVFSVSLGRRGSAEVKLASRQNFFSTAHLLLRSMSKYFSAQISSILENF